MEKSKIGRRFEGKVSIVTASTQGIGFAIAERLGLEGASVVISSRKQNWITFYSAGVVPPSAAKLPYLTRVDFTRNYLTGTIPREWASTKLEYLSITVNNLSGPIPGYLGNISTLIYMSLENNNFSGTVPPELGKLVNLNNLRISSNNFTGRIPDFIQSLKQLQKLFRHTTAG